mgnify:CR=1 FL=1
MYKNKLFNIFKIILIQTFVYLSIFSCLSNTDDKNSVSIDTTSISAKSEATSTAIPSMPTAIPSTPTAIPPTATPNAKKLQEIDPKALDLVINYAKNQCSYFESIVEGNQVIYVQEYKITDNIKPKLINQNSNKFWIFIDYIPTKSSNLDSDRIGEITEYFTKDNGSNLPNHTTYHYDASSYSREAEFLVDLSDSSVRLNNGFCYINPIDFTKVKIND